MYTYDQHVYRYRKYVPRIMMKIKWVFAPRLEHFIGTKFYFSFRIVRKSQCLHHPLHFFFIQRNIVLGKFQIIITTHLCQTYGIYNGKQNNLCALQTN